MAPAAERLDERFSIALPRVEAELVKTWPPADSHDLSVCLCVYLCLCVYILQSGEGKQDSPLLVAGSSMHRICQSGDVLVCGSTPHLALCL